MIICLPNLMKKLEIFYHTDFNIDSNVVYVPQYGHNTTTAQM